MNWLITSAFFWVIFWIVIYLVGRHLDTDDYTRKLIDIPDESDHIYVVQEAYNRYTDQQYGDF